MELLKYIWLAVLIGVAGVTAIWPTLDLEVSAAFATNEGLFPWREAATTNFIHDIATGWVPKLMVVVCIAGGLFGLWQRRPVRPWAFLLLAMLLGPGFLANIALKDQWGRARPVQVMEFGGTRSFTPYWQPTNHCTNNCSFINGDGSFGFMLAAPALILQRRRRLMFWAGTSAGVVFGGVRVMMGAHFLSDTVWAALLMLLTMFVIYAVLYGRRAAMTAWRAI